MSPAADSTAYLGIDLGTSGLKLTLVDSDGMVLAEAEAPYDVRASAPGHAETDPANWVAGLDQAAELLSNSVSTSAAASVALAAIGVTGQMHGVVLVDPDGNPVRPALLWPDQRAAAVLSSWSALPRDVRARLGNPLTAGMSGPLLTWLRANEPASLNVSALATSPKDWLRGHLTGDRSGERTDASATLLWDVVADDWSPEALTLAGISHDLLPGLVACDAVTGTADLSIGGHKSRTGVPVVAGAGDTAAALTALKATQPAATWREALVVNVGTGIQILRPESAPGPRTDPLTHLYADTDGGWYEMLAIQNGGIALSWVQQVLDVSWDTFVDMAKSSAAGSKGAVFVPFLTGERGAIAASNSTACWSFLTTSTGRPEMARSAFEAFAFTIRHGIKLMGVRDGPLLLSGGGAREPWVRQLIADATRHRVTYVPLRSASAVGAAVLAARGVGVDLPVRTNLVEVQPAPANGGEMDRAYAKWLETVKS